MSIKGNKPNVLKSFKTNVCVATSQGQFLWRSCNLIDAIEKELSSNTSSVGGLLD